MNRGIKVRLTATAFFLPLGKTGRVKPCTSCLHTGTYWAEREAKDESSLLALQQQHPLLITALTTNMQDEEVVLLTVLLSVETLSRLQADWCV